MKETIAAIITPIGSGGIGTIRLSGADAKEIAGKVFVARGKKSLAGLIGYTALYGNVRDAGGFFDEAVALYFQSPASYTGEDVIELSVHGGIYVIRRLLSAVIAAGARLAEAGEFTKRALLSGKMDLTAAEAVMDIIGAMGAQAARAALAAREGALFRKVQPITAALIKSAAHMTAYIDYPEDDIPELDPTVLKAAFAGYSHTLKVLLDTYNTTSIIKNGINTAIVGRPNVGKSTLMNLFSGFERSIVTNIPGTTRDIVEETVLVGDIPLCLADTAGLHQTDDPVESIGVEKAKDRLQSAQLVLAMFDGSDVLSGDDKRLIEQCEDRPCIAVVNKSDLHTLIDKKYIEDKMKHVVYISAASGQGVDHLKEAVQSLLGVQDFDPSAGVVATQRQYDLIARAQAALMEMIAEIEAGVTWDCISVTMEETVSALLHLTGERASDTVLDEVFRQFCIGK